MARPATAAVRLLTGEREPVRLATTANIDVDTGGLLTIDGVVTEVGDRVLVKDQTDGSENGIRTASEGQWYRAADSRSARTMQLGTTVYVQEGSASAGKTFRFNTLDPVIGDDALSFVEVNGATAPLTSGLNDSSAVAGNASKFWSPLYFGNVGTGIVHRLNRLFVGEATVNSSDIGPVTTKSWLETLLDHAVAASQFATVSTTGQLAMTGGARSSDFRSIFGSAAGGAQGITGIGHNDDTTPATTPISAGVVGIAFQDASVNGIALNQMDINNKAAAVTPTTAGGVTSGSTWALGLTSGAYAFATTNATGALYLGRGSAAGPQFQVGMIAFSDALNPAIGAGGNGVLLQAHRGQSVRWQNAGGTTDAEIWGAAAGLVTSKSIVPSANDGAALGTGTASFSDLFLASGSVINWNNGDVTLTHVANQIQFAGASSGYIFDSVIAPSTNDGAPLGTATFSWSDLFLASGAVVNFNNGNYTVTHSAGVLTLSGATTSLGTITQGTGASAAGTVTLQGGNSIELGNGRTADGTSNIDFHAESPDTDYSTRLLRNSTANGSFQILHNGSGGVSVTPGSGGFTVVGTGSSLFLSSTAAINFGAGNYTITHSTGNMAFSGSATFVGLISSAAAVLSTSPTAGIGYATGAGGTVTQATSKATNVALNKMCGQITMNAASLAAGAIVTFGNNAAAIAATDTIVANHISGGTTGAYTINARAIAGAVVFDVRNNTAGALAEAIVIQYSVVKAVNA